MAGFGELDQSLLAPFFVNALFVCAIRSSVMVVAGNKRMTKISIVIAEVLLAASI